MLKRILVLGMACLLGTTGCSEDTTSGPSGSVEMTLEIAGTAQIDEVVFTIFGNNMPPMSGTIDTSAPGATASVEVFGLPEGDGYVVELVAVIDDAEPCRGSAPFSIVAGRVTPVAVMLNCKPEERLGSVRVNGKLNICSHLAKVVVAPLQTSVGSSIDLAAQGVDTEGDSIEYFWFAANGQIVNPQNPVTSYVCTSEGTDFIEAFVSDDAFQDCVDGWRVEVRCVSGDGGTGGTGGAGGSGGTGGAVACVPSDSRCMNGQIDPIVEDPMCMLNEPPMLEDMCTGFESVINPASCTPTGNVSTHEVQLLAIAGDCNAGFDLDGCDGTSCRNGGLAPFEGLDGVDNALAGLAPVLEGVGANLGGVDQVLYDGLCDGTIDWAFIVDPNPDESCITVTPVYGGVAADPIPMNLSDTGCVSGQLGSVPLPIAGVQGELGNATVRGTGDVAQGFDVLLGATVADETAITIAEALIDGGGAVVAQVFDINSDLEADPSASCTGLSISLEVGGTLVGSNEGACTNPTDAAVYANLGYINGSGEASSGTDAAAAIAWECIRGNATSTPPILGCGSETLEVVSCFPNCTSETVDALAACAASCQQDAIEEITGSPLSSECSSCYGDEVACDTAFCVADCIADANSPGCIQCRCDEGCVPSFVECSGIPSDLCGG